jgi:hypothetical protein
MPSPICCSNGSQRTHVPDMAQRQNGFCDLLPRHRKIEPFLGCDQVVVAVLADIQLDPLDLTREAVAGRAVIR